MSIVGFNSCKSAPIYFEDIIEMRTMSEGNGYIFVFKNLSGINVLINELINTPGVVASVDLLKLDRIGMILYLNFMILLMQVWI